MKTKDEREKAFRAALDELLNQHGAELFATMDYEPDGTRLTAVEVFMWSQVDAAGEVCAEKADFYL